MKKSIIILVLVCALISGIFATESNNSKYELGLSKKLLFETCRVLACNDNMLVLDEISNYDWYFVIDTETSLPFITQFKEKVRDFQSIQERKDLLHYLNEQEKSSMLVKLVPNALSIATIAFSSGDPRKAIISIAGTALSSFANYTTSKQQSELKLIQEEFELNQKQKDEFVYLSNNIFDYIAKSANKYGFDNSDYASPTTIQKFIKCVNEHKNDPEGLLIEIVGYEKELATFPEYWAIYAKCLYEIGRYTDALQKISIYENLYVKTMYHDKMFAEVMMIKAYCINFLDTDKAKKNSEIEKILPSIIENGEKDNNWAELYYAAVVYKELASSTGNNYYLIKAYECLYSVLTQFSTKYQKEYNSYMDGSFIQNMKNGVDSNIELINKEIGQIQSALNQKNLGKQQKEDFKKDLKDLNTKKDVLTKNKEDIDKLENTYLPPENAFLVSISEDFFDLAKTLNYEDTPEFKIIYKKIDQLIVDYNSRLRLFQENIPNNISISVAYDHKILSGNIDKMKIKVPFEFITFDGEPLSPETFKIFFSVNSFETELTNWNYEIETTTGGKQISISINVKTPVDTGIVIPPGVMPGFFLRFDGNNIGVKNTIPATVDYPIELLKGFKIKNSQIAK